MAIAVFLRTLKLGSWILLLFLCTIQTVVAQSQMRRWYGVLDADTQVFRFVIEWDETNDPDRLKAQLLSLDEGGRRFPLKEFVVDESKLSFQVNSGFFEGAIEDNGALVKGKWTQRGASFAIQFVPVKAHPEDDAIEVWSGVLRAGFQKLVMQVRAYKKPDETMEYFVDSLSEKVGGFRAKGSVKDGVMELDVPALRAKYHGTISDDKNEIKGKWTQGLSFDLVLKRETASRSSVPEIKRPQTPVAPFSYTSRDVQFPADSGRISLSGTLTIPKGEGQFPVAILISGSGPQDRDETLFDHKPFLVLAHHLSNQGIAVLRFDERGVGKSQGKFDSATTTDFANDVHDAVAFVRTQKQIDPERVGLVGHSEGGIIAPLVASRDGKIAWIVLLAATGVNGETILFSQGELIAKAEGATEAMLKQQRKLQELAFDMIKKIDPQANIEQVAGGQIDDIVKQLQGDGKAFTTEEATGIRQAIKSSLTQLHQPWFRFFLTYEPGPALQKVRCPVLALNGSKDLQVEPKLNLSAIESHLKEGGNNNYKIQEMDGLNHLFQTCKSGSISEYASIEETIAPTVLNEVSDWIKAR